MSITNKHKGTPGQADFRLYFWTDNHVVSPFHDLPLWVDKSKGIANMVVEIPRGENAKLEISRDELLNPIRQDVKDGKLRFVHDSYPFNYGALPQTWEDPNVVEPASNTKGDNDPLDALDIGSALATSGQVKQVKVLGIWAMIDTGETDWKIVVIDVTDPLANEINSIEDLKTKLPGKIETCFTFLRDYKIPDGKPANLFAYGGELLDQDFAIHIAEDTHQHWLNLQSGKTKGEIELLNVSLGNANSTSHEEAAQRVGL